MDAKLKGKTALITGGSSGIGLAIAQALAAEGVAVAVVGRPAEPSVKPQFDQYGVPVVEIHADVGREDEILRMFAAADSALGAIDLFVNNAGVARHQPLTKIDAAVYRQVLDTNLSAALWGCREAAKRMIPRQSGAIVVVGSTSMYTPGPSETVYRISKYGLKSLVESLAIELAPFGIRCNLLVPGHFPTRLTQGLPDEVATRLRREIPLRRFGATADLGRAAAFLLSDALSPYTTGAELVVDGGLSLRPLYFGDDDELAALNRS